jgi:hypothetical protein
VLAMLKESLLIIGKYIFPLIFPMIIIYLWKFAENGRGDPFELTNYWLATG